MDRRATGETVQKRREDEEEAERVISDTPRHRISTDRSTYTTHASLPTGTIKSDVNDTPH